MTGDREPVRLIKVINENCQFEDICFTPNTPFLNDVENMNFNNFNALSEDQKMQKVSKIAESCRNNFNNNFMIFTNVLSIFRYISKKYENEEIDIFVTGSLYLIGATLVALEKFSSD